MPVIDVEQRLHLERVTDGGASGAHPAASTQVLEGVDVEGHLGGSGTAPDHVSDLERTPPCCGQPRSGDRREAQAHRDRARVDDLDRDGRFLRRDERGLVGGRQVSGEGDGNDVARTGFGCGGEGPEESLGRRPRGRDRLPLLEGEGHDLCLIVVGLVVRATGNDDLDGDDADQLRDGPASRQI